MALELHSRVSDSIVDVPSVAIIGGLGISDRAGSEIILQLARYYCPKTLFCIFLSKNNIQT